MCEIPTGFRTISLGEVATPEPNSFVDGPFGSNLKTSDYTGTGVRLIQLQNIGEGRWLDANKKYTSYVKLKQLRRHAAKSGDLAIAKMAEPVARACIIPPVADDFIVVADCIKLTVDESRFSSGFLVHLMNSEGFRRQAEDKSTGTTRLRINLTKLKSLEIRPPALPEQRAIAAILDTMDEAIRRTEALIAKLQKVKAGLLHDLLTRGLDEHGQLRDPLRHPEQFKDSELGMIPKEWEVKRLGEVISVMRNGTTATQVDFRTQYPVSRIETISDGRIDFERVKYHIRPEPSYLMEKGDILYSHINSIKHMGKVAFYDGVRRLYHGMNLMLIRPDNREIHPRFLFEVLASPRARAYARNECKPAVNQASLGQKEIKAFPIPKPLPEEQQSINHRLEIMDGRLSEEEKQAQKLRLQKQGLMQDLLTGRVRAPEGLVESQFAKEFAQ